MTAERAVTEFMTHGMLGVVIVSLMVVNHHRQLLHFQHLTKQQINNMEDFL